MNLDSCTPGQREIISTLDQPLMVSAGAGSGKTFTLTQRIAYALTEPYGESLEPYVQSVSQLLAITFTKKAAAELKSRVKAKLNELGLVEEALKVDDAWISTIHGMCSRILKEHALELGIDPTFEVISETESKRLNAQAFEEVIFDINQHGSRELNDYISSIGIHDLGGNSPSIERYTKKLTEKALALPNGFDSLLIPEVQGNPSALLRQLIELGEQFIEVLSAMPKLQSKDHQYLSDCEAALEKANKFLETFKVQSFDDAHFSMKTYSSVFYAFPRTTPKYKTKDSDPEFFADYRTIYAQLSEVVESAQSVKEVRFIAYISKKVYESYQHIKGPARLDNTDLLVGAYKALADNPSIANAYRNQFRLIMIDEFQDTDELQVAILSLLAQSDYSNVCTVGDAQQSIYRFRGADVSVFYAYQAMLEDNFPNSKFINLPDNFRSHADILSLVDRIFSQKEVFGDRFLSLSPKGKVNNEEDPVFGDSPRVEFALFDCPISGPGIAGGRKACAQQIAQHFLELRNNDVSPSDMALLLGSMTNVDLYIQALREVGFECLVSGGSTFSSSYEVGLTKSILKYFSNQLNDDALFQVLSSPLFQVSDKAFLFLVTRFDNQGVARRRSLSEGFLSWPREHGLSHLSDDDRDSIDFAFNCIHSALQTLAARGIYEGLCELLRSSGWLIRLQENGAEGQAIVGNLNKALRMISDLEAEGLGLERSVDQFIHDCETLKLSPGTLSTSSTNFLQIMTIHSSKGLEFPHVAVAEIKTAPKSDSISVENIDGTTYCSIRPKGLESSLKSITELHKFLEPFEGSKEEVYSCPVSEQSRALESFIYSQELAEARRLLYVALTRASKSLFVGVPYKGKKDPDYTSKGVLEDLYRALNWDPVAEAPYQSIEYGGSAPMKLMFSILADKEDQQDAQSIEDKKPFLIPANPPKELPYCIPLLRNHDEVCSYSSLGIQHHDNALNDKETAESSMFSLNESTDEGEATSLGTAFHRLAQNAIDSRCQGKLSFPEGNLIQNQCRELSLTGVQQQRLIHALHCWFDSAIAQELASHSFVYAEVPFMVACKSFSDSSQISSFNTSFFLEGEIDALACNIPLEKLPLDRDSSQIAYLVDYKTGGSPLETDQTIYVKHLLQAQCYAFALLKQGFSEVKACFVRVEQEDREHLGQPQVQRYEFKLEELEYLEMIISEAYKQSRS
ncbi:MAG TPA: UvrD-helicase domain-containing protein [Eggerthellaceae bacterium]|nr:UvrD-helicase domain-containing protein [Eggerthellaceae bacterium]